jgi:hypothetical protein
MQEPVRIHVNKLNSYYRIVNELYKRKELSKFQPYELEHKGKNLTFVFRSDIGMKGAWQIATKIEVIHNDDVDEQ